MKKNNNISIYIYILMGLFLFLANSCKDQLSTTSNDLELKRGKINEKKHAGPDVKDIDGNRYHSVKIGTQVWMAENLKVTHYRNGDPIPYATNMGSSAGAYANYNNKAKIAATYGRLYNWAAVNDSRKIAPKGWHVASDAEWTTLTDFLGGAAVAGGKLKEEGTKHWADPNTGATNEVGFTALPAGSRPFWTIEDTFNGIGSQTYFWTSSLSTFNKPIRRYMSSDNSDVISDIALISFLQSVRCVKD